MTPAAKSLESKLIAKRISTQKALSFASFWSLLQQAWNLLSFERAVEDIGTYDEYLLARAETMYGTQMKGNLDLVANAFYGKDWPQLDNGQKLYVAQNMQAQLRAVPALVNSATKAIKAGGDVVFQLP